MTTLAERNPVEWIELSNGRSVGLHRVMDCPYYDICLTKAVDLKWKGWTCIQCLIPEKVRRGGEMLD